MAGFPLEHEWSVKFFDPTGSPIYTTKPLQATMTLDETWSPYGVFRGTFALLDETNFGYMLALMDPAQTPPPYLELTMRSRVPGGVWGARTFVLWIRDRRLNLRQKTMDFVAATAEVLLQDYSPSGSATHFTYPSLLAPNAIKYTIDTATTAAGGATFNNTASGAVTLDSAFIWKRGVTAWSAAQSAAEANGSRLWANPEFKTVFNLTDTPYNNPNPTYELADVVDFTIEGTRERDGWADAVSVVYRWTDASNVAQERSERALGVPSVNNVWKSVIINRDTPYPGTAAAAGLLARIRNRGASAQKVRAVSDYGGINPGQLMTLDRGPDRWGFTNNRLAAVTWSYPAMEMDLTMRST